MEYVKKTGEKKAISLAQLAPQSHIDVKSNIWQQTSLLDLYKHVLEVIEG